MLFYTVNTLNWTYSQIIGTTYQVFTLVVACIITTYTEQKVTTVDVITLYS